MKGKTFKIIMGGLFAALVFIGTLISVPMPSYGYINIGDCFVLLSGIALGPVGFIASGVGAALADLALGYAIYAPATFFIKFLVSLVIYFVCPKKKFKAWCFLVGALAAEAAMVAGYFLYETLLYGIGGAVLGVLGNCVQGAGNIVLAFILYLCLNKIEILNRIFKS